MKIEVIGEILGYVATFLGGGWILNLYKAKPEKNALEIQNVRTAMEVQSELIAKLEKRAIDFAVTDNSGGIADIVPTLSLDILAPLRNRMLLGQAGATYLTGLTGDIKIPLYSGSKAFWADENASAANGAGSFTHVALTPKRLAAQITVSRRALVQAPAGLEAMLQNDLVNAIADALESTILGNGAGSDNTPKGIFNGAAAVDLTFANVVKKSTMVKT